MNREDFHILQQNIYNHPLIYLDNAATTQKPEIVIEAERTFYHTLNANVHRGVHYLSQQSTDMLENARIKVQQFINAPSCEEIIFTRGTTESINLVASSFGELLHEGDEIIISEMEHHSNIVPWQLLQHRKGIVIKVIPFDEKGILDLNIYKSLFTSKTRLVSVTWVSNVLGTINPVKELAQIAHANNVPILLDAAQAAPHIKIDVQEVGCDFLAFSGHKIYAPTGIGVLYGKKNILQQMPPYQGGGEMIQSVSFEKTIFEGLPYKFEAGTPNYVGSHALGVALDYIQQIGLDSIRQAEDSLTRYATEQLQSIPGLHIYGTAPHKSAVISFLVEKIHHLDMGTLLDRLGIAIRTGHHCAQPIMTHYGIEGTVRASFSFYNTKEDIDALCQGIDKVRQMF